MTEQSTIEPLDAGDSAASVESQSFPGRSLRKAREEKGLSLVEVAQALKFSVRQIEALESDDYRTLQGATFVRGFIRAYARLLRIAPEPLLLCLNATAPQTEVEISIPANMGEATPRPFMERHQKAMIVALAMMTALAIAAYLWTREEAPATDASPAPAAVSNAPSESAVAVGSAVTAEPVAVDQLAPAAVPVPGEKQLLLEFDARSWVEIKDAEKRIILTGEFPQGTRQTVNGRPPFQLWVGKASGVRVSSGEQKIDLLPYARDDVARLTVD